MRSCRERHSAKDYPEGWWDPQCREYLTRRCGNDHWYADVLDQHGLRVAWDDNLCPRCRADVGYPSLRKSLFCPRANTDEA